MADMSQNSGKDPGVIRIGKKPPYAVVPTGPIRESGLSWGAKGVYAFLCGMSEGWEVRRKDLLKRSADGDFRLRQYLRELTECGFLRRQQVRAENRIAGWVWLFSEEGKAVELPEVVEVGDHLAVKIGKMLPARVERERTTCRSRSFRDSPSSPASSRRAAGVGPRGGVNATDG